MFVQKISRPDEFDSNHLKSFYDLILQQDQVKSSEFLSRIMMAHKLAVLYEDDAIIGTAAIKNPRAEYRKEIFEKAGCLSEVDKYPLELGWLCVTNSHRGQGISNKLRELALANETQGMFATYKQSEEDLHKGLHRSGFRKIGNEFLSSRSNHKLVLCVR